MKGLIIKGATWAMLGGLLVTAVGIWDMIKERNVSKTPTEISIADIQNLENTFTYATIKGGELDLSNTYTYKIKTRKRKTELLNHYFVPVIQKGAQANIYILKTTDKPVHQATNIFTGLLQPKDEMPSDLQHEYDKLYPTTDYYLLDTSHKAASFFESIQKVALFFAIAVAGFLVRWYPRIQL